MQTDLINATRTIKHCGDYCHLYWNEQKETAWLVMGDGDCAEPLTTIEEIKTLLKNAGAKKVIVEAEQDPSENSGYVRLAENQNLGIIVENW